MDETDNFARFNAATFDLKERTPPRDILPLMAKDFFIIAEVKKASPSKGIIRQDFNAEAIARSYTQAGAAAISVITEANFFKGSKEDLISIKKITPLPVLRKDFIIHPFQIYESYNLGADFILLIVACLNEEQLGTLYQLALNLGLQVLLEVHNEEELDRALRLNPAILGINNRDLKTFQVDVKISFRLKSLIPPAVKVISESGIKTRADILSLKQAGFNGALIGEALLKDSYPGKALGRLIHG